MTNITTQELDPALAKQIENSMQKNEKGLIDSTDVWDDGVNDALNNSLQTIRNNIGALSELTTESKLSLIAAINEINSKPNSLPPDASDTVKGIVQLATTVLFSGSAAMTPKAFRDAVGVNSDLTTVDKTTLIKAINEINAKISDASTTAKGVVMLTHVLDSNQLKAVTPLAVNNMKDDIHALIATKANRMFDGWTQATLKNGWTGRLFYRKTSLGVVHICSDGTLNGTAATRVRNTTLFTIPEAYLPPMAPTSTIHVEFASTDGSGAGGQVATCRVGYYTGDVIFETIVGTYISFNTSYLSASAGT